MTNPKEPQFLYEADIPKQAPEPENQDKSFSAKSGAFAIVDASILNGIEDPLAKQAIIIPTKSDVVFQIKSEYDDTVLRSMTISPKPSESDPKAIEVPGHDTHVEKGTTAEVTPPEVVAAPVASEGNASPLSHDDTVQRSLRKHQTPRSRRHMQGSDRYRRGSPHKKVMARVKRDSRHQPKPEVEDAFQFILQNSGKSLTEEQLRAVKDPALLGEVMDLMLAMTFSNWDMVEEGTSNGDYLIEDERFSTDNGALLFNDKKLNLAFNWIYETRQRLKKVTLESAWDLSKLVK